MKVLGMCITKQNYYHLQYHLKKISQYDIYHDIFIHNEISMLAP